MTRQAQHPPLVFGDPESIEYARCYELSQECVKLYARWRHRPLSCVDGIEPADTLKTLLTCETCLGTGEHEDDDGDDIFECPDCDGRGYLHATRALLSGTPRWQLQNLRDELRDALEAAA